MTIEDFRVNMFNGMKINFERDGFLTPVLFFFDGENPIIAEIPKEMLSSVEGKNILIENIRDICLQPEIIAGGMIVEGNAVKFDMNDVETFEKIKYGEISVAELSNKVDIVLFIFSTPEGDSSEIYHVDVKNKIIGDKFDDDKMSGRFTSFFKWLSN